jgi:hypothetical protein
MTSIEWLIEQIKEYDFTPPSNNEEYVILMTKWIFDAKIDEAKEMHKSEHGKTWDAALDKYEVRAGNYMRAYSDFDDWYSENFIDQKVVK